MSVMYNIFSRFFSNASHFSTKINNRSALVLYKHLLRQCQKLPRGAKQHYIFSIKQSYKQYRNETDPQRIEEIITRAYEDCEWVLKKYPEKNK